MKRIAICLVFVLSIFCLCSCTAETSAEANTTNELICSMIEQTENYENLSDETIKSLAVIFRTNLQVSDEKKYENYSPSSKRVAKLVEETDGETLDSFSLSPKKISVIQNENWSLTIPKSSLLSLLSKQNISLSNISQIEPKYNDDGGINSILIGGKSISFDSLASNFNIPSNKITSINNSLSNIEISGNYDESNTFNLTQAENCAKLGENYVNILKNCVKN